MALQRPQANRIHATVLLLAVPASVAGGAECALESSAASRADDSANVSGAKNRHAGQV
jgi:hypothetical protein